MPNSQKPRRKLGKRSEGAAHVVDSVVKARLAKHQAGSKRNARLDKMRALPFAHPMNAWRLETVFGPVEKMLAEHDATNTLHFDDAGRAVMFWPADNCYTDLIAGLLGLDHAFEQVASALTWGSVPAGLRAFAFKVARSATLEPQDTADARNTLAWMRAKLLTVTPGTWSDTLAEAQAIEARQEVRDAA